MSTNLTNNENHHQELVSDQQQDNLHQARQIQFQKALEQSLRSYVQYSQQQNQLRFVYHLIFVLAIYQMVELILCVISLCLTQRSHPLFYISIISISINVISLIPSLYYLKLFHQNEIEYLEGLLWFQYDIEQRPDYEIKQILQKSHCFCFYLNILTIFLQLCLLVLIILAQSKFKSSIQEQPLIIGFSLQFLTTARILVIFIGTILTIVTIISKRLYNQIYVQIANLQELEYEQFSPLNKYEIQIVEQDSLSQLSQIQCNICLHNFEIHEEYYILKCHSLHMFHKQCLTEWIVVNQTCPTCRSAI
ncbi:unnamed protein product [Paramecium pentaurelia]|uniref:RING-type domain-containing protein n=1 Tax=Paramecium pentaurelia TaxID=43138 RepID=A0A8S1TP76_9CILI|nr:unnamed protein product [Paramecium pentaurelia]